MAAPSPDAASLVLAQVFVVLLVARTLGRLAARLGFTSVVGELATGFALGPSAFGAAFPAVQRALFGETAALDAVALLGLVLLLYTAGAETDFDLIRERARAVAGAGLLGMALPFALGVGLGFALPADLVPPTADPLLFSLFLGVALSLSAIPVAVRVLVDLDAFDLPVGQVTAATAMFTDVVGWLALSVVAGVARSGTLDAARVGRTVAALTAFLVVSLAVGPRLADAAFARLGGADAGDDAGRVAAGALAAVGSGALTLALGLEAAVGAFVAGLAVSRAGAAEGGDGDGDGDGEGVSAGALESVTFGFFAPVFFGAAGLRADLGLLLDPVVAFAGTATLLAAVAGKFVGAYVGATAAGYSRAEAAVLGSGLNARGAVEIAVAAVGLELGILGHEMYTVIVGMAVLTSAMTPPLLRVTLRRLPRPAASEAETPADAETEA